MHIMFPPRDQLFGEESNDSNPLDGHPDFLTGGPELGLDQAFEELSDDGVGIGPIYGNMTDTTKDLIEETDGKVTGEIGDAIDRAIEPDELGGMLSAVATMTKANALVTKARKMCKFELPTFTSCMAFANPASFGKPASCQQGLTRMKQNLIIYRPNYISCGVLLFFLTILTSPTLLFAFLLILLVWVFALGQKDDEAPPMLGPIPLTNRNKLIMLAPATFLFGLYMASSAIMWTMFLTAGFSSGHAVFHKAPKHMKKRLQERESSIIPMYDEADEQDLEGGLGAEWSDDDSQFATFNLD